MKLLTRMQFLALNEQVVYSKVFIPNGDIGDSLNIKHQNCGTNDWVYTSLSLDLSVDIDKFEDSFSNSCVMECVTNQKDLPMEFEDNGRRDGCYEGDEVMFGVLENHEIESLIKMLSLGLRK